MASYFVRIRQGSPTGPKRGEFGPFPTQKDALKQAQVVADDFVTKGHIVTVEEGAGQRARAAKRRNPAAGKLIVKSVNRNTIARASYSEALHKALSALADDWTDTNDGFDYWGTDNEGEKWRVILKHPKRRNPAKKGTGCRDAAGNFIPIPRCGGGPSPTPTKTIKIKSGDKQLTYTLDSGARTPASAKKKAIALRKLGYKARVKVFPMGIGVYRRGRKKAKARAGKKR